MDGSRTRPADEKKAAHVFVGSNAVVGLGICRGVTPFVVLHLCERQVGLEHGRERIDKRDAEEERTEKIWTHAAHCTNKADPLRSSLLQPNT